MLNFFTKKILTKLRNRAYFESVTDTTGKIKSEGAWRIRIYNMGDDDCTITDGGGGTRVLYGIPGAAAFNRNFQRPLEIGGDPYMITDDELTYRFARVGADPRLFIQFDRLVTKKEDNNYPQDDLMEGE